MGEKAPSGKHVILGTVERGGSVFLLMDTEMEYENSASYTSGDETRFVSVFPAEFDDYEGYKSECQKRIAAIKKARRSGRLATSYVFSDGEEVKISAKRPVVERFLSGGRAASFADRISGMAKAKGKARDVVTEESLRMFFRRDREEILSDLSKVREDLYSHDDEWKAFLRKNGMSVAVILPTYNESNFERNVQLALNVRDAGLLGEIIVTDGYSVRHEPSGILRRLRNHGRDADCAVIRQNGAGKGEAIEAAVKYALSRDHDFCIIVDSDNMPALSRVMPDAPVDIDLEFFVRSFMRSIIARVQDEGKDKAGSTFFKASYMRMPQLKKSFDLRFGIATRVVRDFYMRAFGTEHNLYALSGEVAFDPRFLLERLSLRKDILSLMGMRDEQYCGSNVPGGFCLETVWNSLIEIMGHDVCYVNTYLHHHGPVIKSTKTDIGEQIGEVLTGTFAGMLTGLLYSGSRDGWVAALMKSIPLEVLRPDRPVLDLRGGKISSGDIS